MDQGRTKDQSRTKDQARTKNQAPSTSVRRILEKLATEYPDADTELRYTNAFELLVATILSAQSTDQRVNQVTPTLFARYPNAAALAAAKPAELERQIHSTGFFRAKSKALMGMAQALVTSHGGEVPADLHALIELPGVGRKTANVVLGHALGVPGLPVDRHVLRVANRIGIADSDDPEVVEHELGRALPKERWTRTSDTLILHGRRICRPTPLCDRCVIRDDCAYFRRVISRAREGKPPRRKPTARSAAGAAPLVRTVSRQGRAARARKSSARGRR
jgi:endonuclease-3